MKTRLPFSYALPLLSVALWVLLIAIPVTITYARLQHWAHGAAAVHLHAGGFATTVSREHFLEWSFRMATIRKEHFFMALNLPATSVEALISRLMSTWPAVWYPHTFTHDAWAAITWPFLCLPFWGLAGAAPDALSGRKVRPFWLVLASSLCLLCAFLGIGLGLTMTPDDRTEGFYALFGFGLWTLFFLAAPFALIRRWRNARSKQPHLS